MDYFEVLKKYLSGFLSIPPLEWIYFARLLSVRKLEKDSYFFRQGESTGEIGFVLQGMLYNFYTDSNGKVAVKYFIREGEAVAPYSSLLLGEPAAFSCQAIESCLIVTLQYQDLQKLYARHICWEKMGRVSAEKLYIEKEKRELQFLTLEAAARYDQFMKANSQISGRIPQYLIASYLGISPVSLSRIRKKRPCL